jgi:Ca2+-binding RTX toxin-like protein
LVLDLNGDGLITSGAELFGNATRRRDGSLAPHGFAALAELDGNRDGQIDGRDQGWSGLRVWVDGDADALTDAGELHTLQELGVRDLPLAYLNDSLLDPQGNHHLQIGVFRSSDGAERALVDVWFQVDQTQTLQLNPRAVPGAIAVLPDLPGMGNVASLHQTMAADPEGPLVRLIENWCSADAEGRTALIEPILLHWTGVHNLSIAGGMANSDQNATFRRVLALEKLIGRSFLNTPTNHLPGPFATAELERCFDAIRHELDLLLIAQYEVAPLISLLQRPSSGDGSLRFDASLVLTAIEERQRSSSDAGLTVRIAQAMGRMGEIGTAMLAALQQALEGRSDPVSRIVRASVRSGLKFQSGSVRNDHVQGSGLDWLEGGEGADHLEGGEGEDLLDGGSGNDRMLGGGGDDLYLIGSGNDSITDTSGDADELYFVGIGSGSVRIERHGSDLVVVHGSNSVRVFHHFLASWARIERLSFADGITWTDQDLLPKLVIGGATEGNDQLGGHNNHSNVIDGLGGNDTLRGGRFRDRLNGGPDNDLLQAAEGNDLLNGGPGNDLLQAAEGDDLLDGGSGDDVLHGDDGGDTLIGGVGNDRLFGGGGDDLYRISGRSGLIWMHDLDTNPTNNDRVSFDDLSSSDVLAVERRNSDLLLHFNGGSQLTVVMHFIPPLSRVESFQFADGITWTDQDLLQRQQTLPFLAPTSLV